MENNKFLDKFSEMLAKKARNAAFKALLVTATTSLSARALAQNTDIPQGKPVDTTENVVSQKEPGSAYCNLAYKVLDMYKSAYKNSKSLSTVEDTEAQKCRNFFGSHPDIKAICEKAEQACGRAILSMRNVDNQYMLFRNDLNKKLSPDVVKEIDKIGRIKMYQEDEQIADKAWRMYTHVATNGGVEKNNESANFFKKYPEIYNACQNAGEVMKQIGIPLERTTYSDVQYYNHYDRNPYKGCMSFDEVIGKELKEISEKRGISENEVKNDAQKIKVYGSVQQGGNVYTSWANSYTK